MEFEWDPDKAEANLRKHGVDFADAALVLEDELAVTVPDPHPGEQRFVTMGSDPQGRILVVVLHVAWRTDTPHLCPPGRTKREAALPGRAMKKEYDFSKGKRGPVLPPPAGKTRITIRLDDEVLAWFKKRAHDSGGGNYQTLINHALREYIQHGTDLEVTLRKVLREELGRAESSGS